MGHRDDELDTDAPIADVNVSRAGFDEATDHRGNGLGTDALSQMSTRRERVSMTRRVIETTESARTLYRGCQRAEAGRGGAMDHRGKTIGANAPLRLSTR